MRKENAAGSGAVPREVGGEKIIPVSDLLDHERSTRFMYGVYQSAANRFNGKNPIVNIKF